MVRSWLDGVLVFSGVVTVVAVALYVTVFHVVGVQHMSCFPGRGNTKPFIEYQITKDVAYLFSVRERLHRVETRYQTVEVYRHQHMGNILVIDGSLQITERDEYHYHEMMAHVPMVYTPKARQVLVIGGGDGGGLLRLLQHPNVEKAVLVDIDMHTMRSVTAKYFPHLYPAYLDPRLHAVAYDGAQWVLDQLEDPANEGSFEVVLLDSTDYGAAESLFPTSFYRSLIKLMHPERSVLVLNLDSPSWNMETVLYVQRQLGTVFKYSYVYHTHQPCFLSGHYSFLFLSNNVHPTESSVDWGSWHKKGIATLYYSPDIHYASFVLPNLLRERLTMSITLGNVSTYDSRPIQKQVAP